MESFSELLSDAFSETSGPSFSGEDLDFENLNFDENSEEDEAQRVTAKTDGALLQEATGEAAELFDEEDEDGLHTAEKVYKEPVDGGSDEEDFPGVGAGLMSLNKAPEEDYTSSEEESDEEGPASGDDEDEDEEKPGDLLESVRRSDENEDRMGAGGQPLAPQSPGNPQVSNREQGEAESDEELSYFGQVPEKGSETAMRSDESEEDERESDKEEPEFSSGAESGGMKVEIEEREVDHPSRPHPARAGLDFQCLSLQNLQDLITEVDGEECVEKMKEFSGEEHQDAGESFADYPSDFSSCEYVQDGARDQESDGEADASSGPSGCGWYPQQDGGLERHVADLTCSDGAEEPEEPEEMDAAGLVSLNVAGTEQRERRAAVVELMEADGDGTGESDSYSSSEDDDGGNVRRSGGETSGQWGQQDPENRSQLDYAELLGGSCAMFRSSDDRPMTNSRVDPADLVSWDFNMLKTDRLLSEFVLTTDDTQQAETHTSGVNTEDHNSYSVVKRDDTKSPSSHGSLDDSFFFNVGVETSGGAEEPGSDEYEEERNWEQEQERIKAFYEYYDDSDEENDREGRPTKVQFCAETLSQVIHYESDSDRDSLSSSTDREDDQSSADTSDELVVPDDTQHVKPESEPLASQLQDGEADIRNTQIPARRSRCLGLLKLMLKTGLVTAAGLLMFWLATDEADWLHQVSIF
ncbi:protein starmaker [Salarias fasciatus]|uniref:protein starmaker n=1 Tax=Salarias fasciatus TaxID=181472 RepID=UPI001176D23E|nr:protein starmaker-like [Salarias fasciatus]XP_029974176.1 protein starmaker-like [Salarias fasciatus]